MLGRLSQITVGILMLVMLSWAAPLSWAAQMDAELSIAAMKGDMDTVQALIGQNVDVNRAQGDGTTALHWAAYRDDADMARLLLDAGANVGAETRLGELTPLFMASKSGYAPIIDMLVKAGADVNSQTTIGTTALMMAAASGSADAVSVLLDAGADPNAKDVYQGQTALMFAAAPGRVEVIKVLAERGADIDATSLVPDPRKTEGAGGPKWRKGDIALGGMTPLGFAARDGRMAAVEALLDGGADINKLTASNGMSALTIAILNAHFDVAKYLLEKDADPRPADTSEGVTALYAVIDAQWANRVWYPVPSPEQEETGYFELLTEILSRGVDPNVRLEAKLWQRQMHGDWVDPAGATAFWRAAQANDVPAMRALVEAGANPSIRSKDGVSALQVSTGYGYEPQTSTYIPDARLAAVRYLVEEVGADVGSYDNKGYTPLHGAGLTAEKNLDVIRYLVAMGADVKARANQVFGGQDDPNVDVEPGTGDSVADMANGPKPHNLVHLDAVILLEELGSENSDNCRASTCVNRAKKDSDSSGSRQ
jgi:ankyrin repeat protein